MTRAADILSGARHATPVHRIETPKPATDPAPIWPAANPISEAFWSGVLVATAFFCALFCTAVSFGVFERVAA